MKHVILSIKPLYSREILNGNKTIELRKSIGKEFAENCKVYIYESSPKKCIVGEFSISKIDIFSTKLVRNEVLKNAMISKESFDNYFKGKDLGYAIGIKNLIAYKNEIALAELKRELKFSPPQSWCYVSEAMHDFMVKKLCI